MRVLGVFWALVTVLALAACGGGPGTVTAASTPHPTPTPRPSPAPTPSASPSPSPTHRALPEPGNPAGAAAVPAAAQPVGHRASHARDR